MPPAEQIIQGRIRRAILERRLPPGMRLVEDQLAEAFGVSRVRIRDVLQSLARDNLVTLKRNRGACVARPGVGRARDVFAARRFLEVPMAAEIVRGIGEGGLRRLRTHVALEAKLERGDDRVKELLTAFNFHVLLAETTGNDVIVAFMTALIAQSALISASYSHSGIGLCSHRSHRHLVEFIERGDATGLADAMLAHLTEMEAGFALHEKKAATSDMAALFS